MHDTVKFYTVLHGFSYTGPGAKKPEKTHFLTPPGGLYTKIHAGYSVLLQIHVLLGQLYMGLQQNTVSCMGFRIQGPRDPPKGVKNAIFSNFLPPGVQFIGKWAKMAIQYVYENPCMIQCFSYTKWAI